MTAATMRWLKPEAERLAELARGAARRVVLNPDFPKVRKYPRLCQQDDRDWFAANLREIVRIDCAMSRSGARPGKVPPAPWQT
jgi:hypothetical protein